MKLQIFSNSHRESASSTSTRLTTSYPDPSFNRDLAVVLEKLRKRVEEQRQFLERIDCRVYSDFDH